MRHYVIRGAHICQMRQDRIPGEDPHDEIKIGEVNRRAWKSVCAGAIQSQSVDLSLALSVAKGLTKQQARGIEQALIEKYGLAKHGGPLMNKINSISMRNPIYPTTVGYGRTMLPRLGV